MKALWLTVRQTARLFGPASKLWLPFLVAAVVEILLIGLIWLAPHPPLSKLLAPPIRYFFGERVLHYPLHLWFIYHAMKHTHVLAATLIGAFMSGVACVMVRQAHTQRPLSLRDALVSGQVRYGALLLIWLITWGLAKGLAEAMTAFAPRTEWAFWAGIGWTVILQSLVVYAIPIAVFEAKSWWRALLFSVWEAVRHPMSTLIFVAIPIAAVVAFAVTASTGRVAQFMQTVPEYALIFVALRLIVWTAADALITVGIAFLWLNHRAMQSQPAAARAGAAVRGA